MFLTLSRGIITSIRIRASCIRSRGFKLAITSEIIGKLGGAEVESVEVAGATTAGSNITLHTVEVADGEEVLAVFIGRFSKLPSLETSRATLSLGGSASKADATNRDTAVSAVITETSNVVMYGSTGVNASTLAGGTVYTVKL